MNFRTVAFRLQVLVLALASALNVKTVYFPPANVFGTEHIKVVDGKFSFGRMPKGERPFGKVGECVKKITNSNTTTPRVYLLFEGPSLPEIWLTVTLEYYLFPLELTKVKMNHGRSVNHLRLDSGDAIFSQYSLPMGTESFDEMNNDTFYLYVKK